MSNIGHIKKLTPSDIFSEAGLREYTAIVDEVLDKKDQLEPVHVIAQGLEQDDLIGEAGLKAYLPDENILTCKDGQYKLFRHLRIGNRMLPHLMEIFPDHSIRHTGAILYEPGNYMGWHTNSDYTGHRMYISYADKDAESFFRYYINGEIVTDFDDKGINVRIFNITEENLFWHCVYSSCNRVSLGFYVSDNFS